MYARSLILSLFALLSLSACIHHKELVNFNEGPEFADSKAPDAFKPLTLQPDDLLSITIQAQDPKTIAPFTGVGFSSGLNAESAGKSSPADYLIDAEGQINFPVLGKLKAAGMSTQQLRDTLTARVAKFVQSPIINVRLLNFRFSVMGEVGKAGAYSIPNEKVNILQALSMAGDISTYGNRKNVLVIREKDGLRTFGHLDLHKRDVFNSPYYYLMQNDVVYVEPLPAKVGNTSDQASKFVLWAAPLVSIISIIVTLTR